MTCQQCHWENPLNEPSGRVRLDGIPDAYTPGEQYLITVTLARPGMEAAGFQLSAREDGMSMNAGSNAGTLRALDALAETLEGEAKRIRYLQHTRAGAEQVKAGGAAWRFEWTAPDEGPVIFHLAANAANGDDSPLGDFIYTAVARSRAR